MHISMDLADSKRKGEHQHFILLSTRFKADFVKYVDAWSSQGHYAERGLVPLASVRLQNAEPPRQLSLDSAALEISRPQYTMIDP